MVPFDMSVLDVFAFSLEGGMVRLLLKTEVATGDNAHLKWSAMAAADFKFAYDIDHLRLSAGTLLTVHLTKFFLGVDKIFKSDFLIDDVYGRAG